MNLVHVVYASTVMQLFCNGTCECTHVCTHTYTHTHAQMHTHMHALTHTHIHTCMHQNTHTCTHTYTVVNALMQYFRKNTHIALLTDAYANHTLQ